MEEDRRHPLRELDLPCIEPFLAGRTVIAAELLPYGKSNTNYKLQLSDGEVCVLRLTASDSARRENGIMNLVRDIVPVPQALAEGDDWTIHSFMTGVPLSAVPQATFAAAEALAHIARVTFPNEGWIQADGSVTPFDFGGQSFVASMLARADVQEWLGREAVAHLAEIEAAEARRQPELPRPSCLCHGDYNPTNILIHYGAVSAVLDWEFAHSGSTLMDVGNLLRHTAPAYHDDIRAGLTAGGVEVPADWKMRAQFVDLSSHLEFLITARSDDFKRLCVAWINRFILDYHNR